MKIVKKKNQLKIVIFTAVKNRCMLHGHVFVMLRGCWNYFVFCKICKNVFTLLCSFYHDTNLNSCAKLAPNEVSDQPEHVRDP